MNATWRSPPASRRRYHRLPRGLAIGAADGVAASDELAAEILASLDGRLARMKWPRSIDFADELPHDPSGKLLKRRLRAPYWERRATAIY
jgi:acyl-coenzyme A synthetase/AMP-(fatty) acid ligase